MKSHSTAVRAILFLSIVAVCSAALWLDTPVPGGSVLAASRAAAHRKSGDVSFNRDGELVRPSGYRRWIYVGSPLTPHDMNNGKAAFPEFHSVYINPEAYDHYEKTGEFPDGTVLVKELVSVGTKQATSGHGYFMGEFTGLEVLMKDRRRFQDEPGHWGFFSFGHEYPLKSAARMQATSNCNDCHGGAADDDYVFTQYYPVLRATKGSASGETGM